jgi:ribose 5-phosphate isomerase B
MLVAFGADHAGFELKQYLLEAAKEDGHGVLDLGAHSTDSVDFPDFGEAVARAVAARHAERGVVVCSNGVGISIAANKVPGIRCALCHSAWGARRAREHVDANVLALGSWEVGRGVAVEILRAFLDASFDGGERFVRRLEKLSRLEQGVLEAAAP